MRKNNSSLLLTILGGAIFCFVFLGMAFIYTNGTKIMSGNNTPSIRNNEEEINLGDTCNSWNYTDWDATSYGSWTCGTPSGPTGTPQSNNATGTSWNGVETGGNYNCVSGCTDTCYRTVTYTRTQSCASYSSCDFGKYLNSSNQCEACPSGKYCAGGIAQPRDMRCEDFDGVSNCPSQIEGTSIKCYAYDGECHSTPSTNPVIVCLDNTYNGREQTIATCAGGTLSNHKKTNVGSYEVTCTIGSNTKKQSCSIQKASNTISNADNISLSRTGTSDLNAHADFGTVTYSITSGNSVVLTGNTVRAFKGGTTVIKASVAGTSNYNSATANITVTVPSVCPAGQGYDSSATTGCSDCTKGYYSEDNDDDCHKCPNGKTSPAGATSEDACVVDTTKCGAGQGKDPSATTGCSDCARGYYSIAGDDVCHKCNNGKTSAPGSTSCEINYTAPCCIRNSSNSYTQLEDATQCSYAAKAGADVSSGACPTSETCKVSISTVSVKTSVAGDGVTDSNSYYTVVVNLNGANCAGQTVTYTATNAKEGGINPTSYTVQSNFSGTKTLSFTVRPENPCIKSQATATLTNGDKSTSREVTIQRDWSSAPACEKNPSYTSFSSADRAGADEYYSDYGTCADGTTTGWTKKWTRGRCGSGKGSTTSPKCYSDDNDGYHWTTSPEPTWKVVSGISNETFCGETENEACYVNPNGEYQWGQYAKTEGYTLVTSINERTICLTQEGKCYKNANNKYVWSETKPNACIQVNTCWVPQEEAAVEQTGECTFTTQEACETEKGYTEVTDATTPKDCAPQNEACYIRESDGIYKWGDYANVTGYYPLQYEDDTPVPEEMCSNEVPDVPKTSMDVTKIVYICMAVLMAAGVGFIYYSTVMKKQND